MYTINITHRGDKEPTSYNVYREEEAKEKEDNGPVLTLEMLTDSFYGFVKSFLHQKLEAESDDTDETIAEIMLMSIVISIHFLKNRSSDCEVFLRFLINEYQ